MRSLNRRVKQAIRSSRHTVKHIVDYSTLGQNGAINTSNIIATATDNPLIANVTNVASRSKVSMFYMDIVFSLNAAAVIDVVKVDWYIINVPTGTAGVPQADNTSASAQKNYIFKQGMGMPTRATPYHVSGWVRVPKKYATLGDSDQLTFVWKFGVATAASTNQCAKFIYKEYKP